MACSLQCAMSVAVKRVAERTPVPALAGDPFGSELELEPGAHVHWRLPEALTRARLMTDAGPEVALFPGVPDLWLVTRFNPGLTPLPQSRTWRAWVVDSYEEKVTALDDWSPPEGRDVQRIHTAIGILDAAAEPGPRGWGVLRADADIDPMSVAYYPACRTRFGLHDPLDDIPHVGDVSYTVVGWYWSPQHDPLYMCDDREELVERWRLAYDAKGEGLYAEVPTPTTTGKGGNPLVWKPSSIEVSPSPKKPFATASDAPLLKDVEQTQMLLASVSDPNVPTTMETPKHIYTLTGPSQLLCHGSVMELALQAPTPSRRAFEGEVHLFPDIRRALSGLAAGVPDDDQREFVELLLGDIDQQGTTLAGVIDYPGAAHAATFQSAPGAAERFARIIIADPQSGGPWPIKLITHEDDGPPASGHWPPLLERSASLKPRRIDATATASGPRLDVPAQGLDRASFGSAVQAIRAALVAAVSAAASAGTAIDDRYVYLTDLRGSASAESWIDVEDDDAVARVLGAARGATLRLPDAADLYVLPGVSWSRPWAPQLVLLNASRSTHLERLQATAGSGQQPNARVSGETLAGYGVGPYWLKGGTGLIDNAVAFGVAGLPTEVPSLLAESLLLDPQSASALADAAQPAPGEPPTPRRVSAATIKSAMGVLWIGRDPALADAAARVLETVVPLGQMPSPVAMSLAKEDYGPLFLDVEYAHPYSTLEADWTLKPEHVELSPRPGQSAVTPKEGQIMHFRERRVATSSILKILESALITRETLDAHGIATKANATPAGVEPDTFQRMDVVSVPLTGLDEHLFAAGRRERSGALRIDRIDIVDCFGTKTGWSSGVESARTDRDLEWSFWTALTPRLPFWARLRFSLQAATDPSLPATVSSPPLIGVLLPDLVEGALEVFDGDGRPIGQLTSDRGRLPDDEPVQLAVRFEVHPWVLSQLPEGAEPLDAIANPTLRRFVESLLLQGVLVPASAPDGLGFWHETGLTAMLRVVDTVRATLDPSRKTPERPARLLGEPILMMAARLELEGTPDRNPTQLAGGPAALEPAPPAPALRVRIGDVTRPDDGVLGCFVASPQPSQGNPTAPSEDRFAAVSATAVEHAVFNAVWEPPGTGPVREVPARHPFVSERLSEFEIAPGETLDVVVLADPRGDLYATCGVLPRFKCRVPTESIGPVLERLEPTFGIGPVITERRAGRVEPFVPPPGIEGMIAKFVTVDHTDGDEPPQHVESVISAVPPVARLPLDKALLDRGWIRMTRAGDEQSADSGATPTG